MNTHFYLTGAQVVLENETLQDAAVLIADGNIVAIDPASSSGAQEIDLRGQILMPGMIDLHCDALEKEAEPRPGVHFPFDFACAQADKRNAAAGITTIYHALSFANAELGVRNNATAAELARAVHAWQEHALVDNRVHARYEITDPTAPEVLNALLDKGEIHLLSFMDHTPGQGQFKSVDAYRNFLARTYKKDDAEFEALLAAKLAQGESAKVRMELLAERARALGVPLASHDDDQPEKVEVVKALDAVKEGAADCLCGDYSPAALLPAVMKLPELAGLPLHEAVALVTCNPARAVSLDDRGSIAAGKRADLLAVRYLGGLPQVSRVWSEGLPVMTLTFDHGA